MAIIDTIKKKDTGDIVYPKTVSNAVVDSDSGKTIKDILNTKVTDAPEDGKIYVRKNGAWEVISDPVDMLPVGTILYSNPEMGNIFGDKWLPCDGSVISSSSYPDLDIENKIVWNESVGFPLGITEMAHCDYDGWFVALGYNSAATHSRDQGKTFFPPREALLSPYKLPYSEVSYLCCDDGFISACVVCGYLEGQLTGTSTTDSEYWLDVGSPFFWGANMGDGHIKIDTYCSGICYNPTDECFYALSNGKIYKCDSYDWSQLTTSGLGQDLRQLHYIGNYLVTWGYSGFTDTTAVTAYKSTNGTNWIATSCTGVSGRDMGLANGFTKTTTGRVYANCAPLKYTTDGTTWVTCTHPSSLDYSLRDVTYVSNVSTYYAFSHNFIYTSTDGINWSEDNKFQIKGMMGEVEGLCLSTYENKEVLCAYNSFGECFYTDFTNTGLPNIENAYIKVLK